MPVSESMEDEMRSRRRQKKSRLSLGCLTAILFLMVICAIGIYGYNVFGPTKERVDLASWYDGEDQGGTALYLNFS